MRFPMIDVIFLGLLRILLAGFVFLPVRFYRWLCNNPPEDLARTLWPAAAGAVIGALGVVLFLHSYASAETLGSEYGSINKDPRRGFFWYDDPDVCADEAVQDPNEPAISIQNSHEFVLLPAEKLMEMHPDDLKLYGEKMLKRAVHKPTIERVQQYYEVQDVMRRKALMFANVTAAVARMNPEMSWESAESPAGQRVDVQQRIRNVRSLLEESKKEFALVYFFEADCPYCQLMDQTLDSVQADIGWTVRRMQLSMNRAVAKQFGITKVPYLMLIWKRSKDFFPVGQGVISADRIKKNVYQGIRYLRKDVSPEQFLNYEKDEGTSFDPTVQHTYRQIQY